MDKYDLSGQRFNRLLVIERAPHLRGRTAWLCLCDCGNKKVLTRSDIVTGHSKSCGCLNAEVRREKAITHGMNRTRTYICWSNMRSRCGNPNQRCYKNYGGRGISVCERWAVFENFLADMGEKPKGLSLERIDVNGDYEPKNCKWITLREQSYNLRKTIFAEVSGRRVSVARLAHQINEPYGRVLWAVQRYGDDWMGHVQRMRVRAAAAMGANDAEL